MRFLMDADTSRNDERGKQRSVRLQNEVRWIHDMIDGTDSDDCVSLTMSGWEYERCWS